MTPEKIARINELAKKKKTEGLTPEEEVEQAKLREEYLRNYAKCNGKKVCMAVVSMTLIHKQKSAGRDSSTLLYI